MTMPHMKVATTWGSAIVLAVLLAGCSTSAAVPPEDDPLADADLSAASAAQAAEISDRTATQEEYQVAFHRYEACLSAAGFELSSAGLDDHVYRYTVPDAAVQDGADDECYRAEFYFVDMLWQGSDLVQDSRDSTQWLRECLEERGIEAAATKAEMHDQLREAGVEPPECLQ